MAATKISLKLWIDKKRNRVLFAEAGKDFVDFLLETFTLPVVTVTRFLKNEDTAGCLQSLYDSVVNLSDTFIRQGVSKDLVLKPRAVTSGATDSLLLPRVESYTFRKFYRCRNSNCMSTYGVYKSTRSAKNCYVCNSSPNQMHEVSLSVEEVISENKESGNFSFVKEIVPYMVMDDLRMKPMSSNTFITLLNEYNLKDVGAIEEKVVALGMDECVKLIKAALQSKTVLTDVFLPRPSETVESIKTSGTSEGTNKGSSVSPPDE
ncbi:hypothetical protein I3843_08G028300 [Carya illinoinensis]|uniref:Uncharacterized protein n=1 Tax=Carya illinoinensis TaxID=32201 RepID=A0A8T1PSY6_CARIL|nr:uncharacterized protein LOC122319139 [Carya illinoinensis]KAG6644052.1 hypothetical protein CIPAW_08G028700 [Carya illinoinensis]KAG6698637.1 hypothetical protein I3842_08G029100 [Carya illinoinensis]KAG7966007.1 hypothetical protein I3843_08G028300 [Carya illinoinensis]